MSSKQFSTVINWALPEGWKINSPTGLDLGLERLALPEFSLAYQQCPLLDVKGIRLQWRPARQFTIETASLDYQCLSQLPATEKSDSPTSIKALLALLPEGEASLNQLMWRNVPNALPPRVKALLDSPSQIKLAYQQQKLTANLSLQGVGFSLIFADQNLNATLDYQPNASTKTKGNSAESHRLQLNAKLSDNLSQLPTSGKLHYQWRLPKEIIDDPNLQQGEINADWQTEQENKLTGELRFISQHNDKNRLTLPFKFDFNTLEIVQAPFYWEISKIFPLQGVASAKISPKNWTGDFFPIQTYFRFSFLSQSKKAGKGNIVIENKQGEIQPDALNLPLQLTGNVKYDDFILYSAVPIAFQGKFDDLSVRFQPSALLRLVGKQDNLIINELRFPMAGILVNKNGITGRLQALLKGETPEFKQLALNLDGYAKNFHLGQNQFFQKLKGKKAINDLWQWRIWGDAQVHSLKTPLKVAGRGKWQGKLVTLSELDGQLGKLVLTGTQIPKIDFSLSEPIEFAYTKRQIKGEIKAISPETTFNYGGELTLPVGRLKFNGTLENFNIQGQIEAGKLGPLKLFARRSLKKGQSELVGKLYWYAQSAKVFQPLLPLRQNWIINQGTVKGETAFSANAKQGLVAGGHFSIMDGGLSIPSGDINGIQFSLPYRLQQGQFTFGVKQPIAVNIDEMKLGLPITNVRVKVNGSYPYSKKRPLYLRELKMDLLGGSLQVDHFALPQTSLTYLKLNSIDFEEILNLIQYQQIELKGKADAILPLWLEGKPCYVCDGLITQGGGSRLKFTPELLNAMKNSGYTEQLLLYLMNDTKINDLRALVNVGSKGDMVLDAKLKMELNEQQSAKINFNYNHRENLFDLWKLINIGNDVEQQIENKLYQILDKRK